MSIAALAQRCMDRVVERIQKDLSGNKDKDKDKGHSHFSTMQ
jgi:hypothetical protein